MGHHRFRIILDARMEAPATVPDGQVPADADVKKALTDAIDGIDLGGTYKVYVNDAKYQKKKIDKP